MILENKQASFEIDREVTGANGSSPEFPTAIIGLGNPLRGDDGAGCEVLSTLAQTAGLPQNINLLEGETSELIDAILSKKYERVILIDAAEIGRQPGEWICLNADQVSWTPNKQASAWDGHQANLANLLALGHVLDTLPGEVLIYAVQPLSLEWSGELSKPVGQAVSQISASILRVLGFESSGP